MFISLSQYLLSPIILFILLYAIYTLFQNEPDENAQFTIIIATAISFVISAFLMVISKQVLDIDYISLDPISFIPRTITLPTIIILSAIIAILIQNAIQSRPKPVKAAVCIALFVFMIYLTYFDLALKFVAALIISGILLGMLILVMQARIASTSD